MSYLKILGQTWVPEEGCYEEPPASLQNKHRTLPWPTEMLWSLKSQPLNPSMQMRMQSTAWASLPWNILRTTQTFSVEFHSFTAPSSCKQGSQTPRILTRRSLKKVIFFFPFLVTYWYFTIVFNNSSFSTGFPQSQRISTLRAAYSRADFGRAGLYMKTILLQTHKDFYSKQCRTL